MTSQTFTINHSLFSKYIHNLHCVILINTFTEESGWVMLFKQRFGTLSRGLRSRAFIQCEVEGGQTLGSTSEIIYASESMTPPSFI